jgi:hypothetical protein
MKLNKRINLVDVPEFTPKDQPIEPGIYNVVCESIEVKGEGSLSIRLSILEGRFKTRSVWFNCNYGQYEMQAQQFKSLLKALNFSNEDLVELGDNMDDNIYSLIDARVKIKTINRESNGRMYTNILFFSEPDSTFANVSGVLAKFKDKEARKASLEGKEIPSLL